MLSYIDRSAGNVLGVKATGKLTHADHQQLVPKLEELIREYGKVRMLFDLEDCEGWNLRAVWDDLKFALRHGGEVERCAVVGEKRWQEIGTQMAKPFFQKIRYFDKSQSEEAWQWVLAAAPAGAPA
ncbi:MAG TPA: STAS/SEC14 domain-containing protein [Gemmataceae bacterium]|nr:STAS/SEC14 domain-containing protein [Gemmataceae bacterium]